MYALIHIYDRLILNISFDDKVKILFSPSNFLKGKKQGRLIVFLFQRIAVKYYIIFDDKILEREV